jgi:hypothetical protein
MSSNMMKHNDDKLMKLSRQLLENSLDDLDDSVLARLRQSRQLAINAAAQQPDQSRKFTENISLLFPNWLVPASSAAAFAIIAITVSLFWIQPLPEQNQISHFIEDVNLLSHHKELDLYQNLEFYLWLEGEDFGGESIEGVRLEDETNS